MYIFELLFIFSLLKLLILREDFNKLNFANFFNFAYIL